MNSINKMETFITRGWNPEEISLEGYLSICSKLKDLNEDLQLAALQSDKEYNEKLPQVEKSIEDLLKDFDFSDKAGQ